ncbi:MAG TPA: hypothetical protein PK668_01715 [Myxococcota bacterium]|nr:hypothetical protein [Myxococcota bacterium]HRY94715.1 hypothetical protein [Myxococcota bacterium]HSA22781.1 hypothetical protein [Myxococcota bacterium]
MRTRLLACLCLLLPGPAWAGEVFLSGGAHALLLEVGPGWGAGLDLGLSAAWAPIPEVVLGLDAEVVVPLPSGQDERPVDACVRAAPTVGLRFGSDSDWGFVRAGLAFQGVVGDDGFTPLMTFVAGAGYAVAPEELPFYFGFELVGEIELVGALRSRHIGLGGFLGARL